jgi:hypothetical protein
MDQTMRTQPTPEMLAEHWGWFGIAALRSHLCVHGLGMFVTLGGWTTTATSSGFSFCQLHIPMSAPWLRGGKGGLPEAQGRFQTLANEEKTLSETCKATMTICKNGIT